MKVIFTSADDQRHVALMPETVAEEMALQMIRDASVIAGDHPQRRIVEAEIQDGRYFHANIEGYRYEIGDSKGLILKFDSRNSS